MTDLSGIAIKVFSRKISHVPPGLYQTSKLIGKTLSLWKTMGDLETFSIGNTLNFQKIVKPIFVAGLARSGSTIVTEIINEHPLISCHHYSDFPLTWIPYWWNSLRRQLPLPEQILMERAHKDRLMITNDSPEAVEEVLWMNFFPDAHKAHCCHEMNGTETHPKFEKYYRDHIRKLLLVRNKQRYLAKNNYHVTRLEYLLKLFPDARFIIPIRDPVQQVASLVKQHRLFCKKNTEDSRVSEQLQLSGHFEFGPLRCPTMITANRQLYYVQDSQNIEEVDWYAKQWADVYGFLFDRMQKNTDLASACHILRYEKLCSQSKETLDNLFRHINLDDDEASKIVESYVPKLSPPDYYQSDFGHDQIESIRKLTNKVAGIYSYG